MLYETLFRRLLANPTIARRLESNSLLIFFGIAIVLSITTILGTWDEQKNGVVDPTAANNPAATSATAK